MLVFGPAVVLERIAADHHVGMRLGDLAERRADVALAAVRLDASPTAS